MEFTLLQAAATALVNISFAWIVGVLASRYWMSKQAAAWHQAVDQRLSIAMLAGLLACIAGIFLSLWTESSMMGDVAWLDAWPACAEMMTSTHYGHAGVAAIALLVAAVLTHIVFRRAGAGIPYIASMTALLMLVAAARVTIGHAYAHGPFSVAIAAEWLHLLLMALWAGIVFVAGWLVLPQLSGRGPAAAGGRAAYLTLMSDWAAVALAGILATGTYNSYRVLGSPRDLLETGYGNVLIFKLVMVSLAVALGGYNKFRGLPAALSTAPPADASRGLRRVITALRIESLALLLALIAAAVLTSSAPPDQSA